MKTTRLAFHLLLPTLMLAATSCSINFSPAKYHETRTLNVAHVPDSAIHLATANGSIVMRAADRQDVEIVAELRMTSPERLDATKIHAERDGANRLTVKIAWPDGKRENNEGCSFTVSVPDARDVDLKSSNGRLEITGLSGEAELDTSNGKIEVKDHKGNVNGETSNGAIRVSGTEGNLDLRTSNGRITVRDATGSVKANSSNGSVHISLAADGTGPVRAESSNGSMTLEIGDAFRGDLELRNSNGSLDVGNLPDATIVSSGKHHMRLKFGESTNHSRVSTSNGAIHVHHR